MARHSIIFASPRARALALFGSATVAAGAIFACTGDDNNAPPGGTPSSLDSGTPPSNGDSSPPPTGDGAPPADATPPPSGACSSLPGTVVYIESGDTQENLLKRLGRELRNKANITIAFNLTGSCTLTNDIYTGAKMVPNGTLKYIPSQAEDPNWDPSKPEATCTTDAAGAPIDVAISALFVESCGLGGPPAGSGLALIQGPIQAYTFVVPTASTQTAIWAEEAYYAFGFGNNNPLGAPWNNEQFLFIRPPTKSTLVATAFNIDVPPNKWKGVPEAASSDVVNAVKNSASPENTIGILGDEVYDANRGKGLNVLAYKAFGQNHAYYPDSTSTSFDKQNVRDGHYTLWSPTVYITKVDASSVPTNPAVKTVVDAVLGNPIALDGGAAINGLADVVKVGLVPECAMKVTRSADGGPLSPFTPPSSCTCYYLSQIPNASGTPTGCTTCTTNADCSDGGGTCSHGFCEPDSSIAPVTGDGGAYCFSGTPTTNSEIINACTNAQAIDKNVNLAAANLPDGGLKPLP